VNFKDLISQRNAGDYVMTLRKEIYRDIKFVSNNKTQIEKLFLLIKEIKEENFSLLEKN
jgi:hypothetical protein